MESALNIDLAIRRFCPARVEEEQKEWEEIFQEIELCSSPTSQYSNSSQSLANSELDEFVENFFNADSYEENFNMMKDSSFKDDDDDEMDIIVPSVEEVSHGVDRGLHLVHMTLACAEAVGCRDTRLVESMLSQIWASVSPSGDALQRVLYCFALGLKSRLSLLRNVNANGAFVFGGVSSEVTKEERLEAFRLLLQMTPFVTFGFTVANESICQTAIGKEYIHVVDLGSENTLQWPSLVRNLSSRPEGPPKRLRITSLVDDHSLVSELEASARLLVEEANSLGVFLEFKIISDSIISPSLLTREKLNLRDEDALFVNGFTRLHKFVKESRGSLKAILQAVKRLSPALLTVVEQDANHNGPFFLGRFLESLHYYSAIFDSLEASLPRNSSARMNIERLHFSEEIRNIVACEGSSRTERHERVDQWRRQLGRAGFHVVGLKCVSQVRMMLSVYGCDGFTLSNEKGCLLLGWQGRSILLASAWQVNNLPSS